MLYNLENFGVWELTNLWLDSIFETTSSTLDIWELNFDKYLAGKVVLEVSYTMHWRDCYEYLATFRTYMLSIVERVMNAHIHLNCLCFSIPINCTHCAYNYVIHYRFRNTKQPFFNHGTTNIAAVCNTNGVVLLHHT